MTDDAAISAVAALGNELRRGMYRFARRLARPMTRDEVAEYAGISLELAAFHLDRLVEAGLLQARYEHVGLRPVGPASRVYEPTDTEVQVSLPERRHDLLARILMQAVLTESGDENARDATVRVAADEGIRTGRELREQLHTDRVGAERALSIVANTLDQQGFEPAKTDDTCLRLRNCPFHPLATQAPELVCGLNYAYVAGLVHGLDADAIHAELVPVPGECCVEISVQPQR
ncbi:helix-turn-helix transcriptional regulator [Nocardia stercoris]|uniref:Transcriptional regulator n=1 Tax=Nocardia stercoris TaxID=2483361 RepID=A0A3M2L601_9NOCA|nr:transcriptional regulator [Nocardia stercoris]RMI31335.1 transcriptional regulator [Nocardia stercoris]